MLLRANTGANGKAETVSGDATDVVLVEAEPLPPPNEGKPLDGAEAGIKSGAPTGKKLGTGSAGAAVGGVVMAGVADKFNPRIGTCNRNKMLERNRYRPTRGPSSM